MQGENEFRIKIGIATNSKQQTASRKKSDENMEGEAERGKSPTHKNHWKLPTAIAKNEIKSIDSAFFLLNNPE